MTGASGSPLPFPNPQPVDLGTLQVALLPTQGPPQILGTVDNTAAAYQATAAIQEFDVTAEQVALLNQGASTATAQQPMTAVQEFAVVPEQAATPGLMATNSPQFALLGVLLGVPAQIQPVVLAEDGSATSLAVTPMVCRLNPGDSVQIDLVALSFGAPAANQTIGIQMNNGPLLQQPPGSPPVGTSESVLQFPPSVTTDANGRASFMLTAAPEGSGNPRSYIDGQVYGIGFNYPLDSNPDPNVFVSVHVYTLVPVPDFPDWETDVLPILLPYRELYPFMKDNVKIDLSDQSSVLQNAAEIACRMQLPETDPRYMPVTRDLSENKKQIVLKWLAQQTQRGQGGATGG